MKTIRLLLICTSFALVCALAPAAHAGVTVTKVSYAGWHGALRISNGIVSAVVVPQIGRIMVFQMVNHPETDPVFANKDWAGKTVAGVPKSTWANFGGDKAWPANQYDWAKLDPPNGWPPDRALDGDPESATILKNGVRLESPMSASFAARYVRVITMKPGQPRLYIHQVLEKDPKVKGSKNAFPIGIWSITQTRGDEMIFMPVSGSAENPGFYIETSLTSWVLPAGLPADAKALWNPTFWKAVDGVMVGRRDPKNYWKFASGAGAGWLASLYSGNVLFSEHYSYQKAAHYADGGFPTECYNNANPAYFEMELMGPVAPLRAGKTQTYDIYWQLNHLPRVPKSDDDACALVKLAM